MEAIIGLIVAMLWIWGIIWVYRDAEERKGMGCLLAILVFLTGPLGIIVWLILRPEGDYYQ